MMHNSWCYRLLVVKVRFTHRVESTCTVRATSKKLCPLCPQHISTLIRSVELSKRLTDGMTGDEIVVFDFPQVTVDLSKSVE